MSKQEQEHLTPMDMLREELTEERLLSNHLICTLAAQSVDGCRQAIEQAPYISDRCRKEALDYLEDLVYTGKC